MKQMQENEQPANTKRRRQIDDVLKKCQAIENEIAVQLPTSSQIAKQQPHNLSN